MAGSIRRGIAPSNLDTQAQSAASPAFASAPTAPPAVGTETSGCQQTGAAPQQSPPSAGGRPLVGDCRRQTESAALGRDTLRARRCRPAAPGPRATARARLMRARTFGTRAPSVPKITVQPRTRRGRARTRRGPSADCWRWSRPDPRGRSAGDPSTAESRGPRAIGASVRAGRHHAIHTLIGGDRSRPGATRRRARRRRTKRIGSAPARPASRSSGCRPNSAPPSAAALDDDGAGRNRALRRNCQVCHEKVRPFPACARTACRRRRPASALGGRRSGPVG